MPVETSPRRSFCTETKHLCGYSGTTLEYGFPYDRPRKHKRLILQEHFIHTLWFSITSCIIIFLPLTRISGVIYQFITKAAWSLRWWLWKTISQHADTDNDAKLQTLRIKVLEGNLLPQPTTAWKKTSKYDIVSKGYSKRRDNQPSFVVPIYPYFGVSWRSRSHVPNLDPSCIWYQYNSMK